ncbi:MAG TPA: TraB/GumN family protein [Sphingomicrobium sp.]|nr:TraB/GumN family protein [Sphingomicrobium sp.]
MGILSFLLGAAMAASPAQPAIPSAPPQVRADDPALWVVNDDDTIIYLFGTFHALNGDSRWFEQAVKTAFSASDELMLETVVPRPGMPPGAYSPQPGVGHPAGPVAQLAPSASYLATTKLVMNAGRRKGMSTDNGADAVLRDAADEAGKPVGGLESFDFQLRMFSSLPGAPSDIPPQDQRTIQALGAMLNALQAGWHRGAVEETFAPLLRKMRVESPQTYNVMFVERNARWAHWIAERMKTPGTVFVAVGAGHLSGPDSVQNKLAMLGVRSARIN